MKIRKIKKLIKLIKKIIFLSSKENEKFNWNKGSSLITIDFKKEQLNFILYCLKKELKKRRFENYEQYFKKYYEPWDSTSEEDVENYWLEKLWNEED